MAVKLMFLGRLADLAGAGELPGTVGGWSDILAAMPMPLAEAVREPRVRVARNGALVADKAALVVADGDELAFLPPVSGG